MERFRTEYQERASRGSYGRPMTDTDKPEASGTKTRDVWERYVSAWKASSKAAKLAALAGSVDTACTYRDPLAVAIGHEQLVAYMLDFHRQVPGGHFVTTYFQAHHDRSIAKWNMVDGSGRVIGDGVSFGEYSAEGRLVTMTGFFEPPPTAA